MKKKNPQSQIEIVFFILKIKKIGFIGLIGSHTSMLWAKAIADVKIIDFPFCDWNTRKLSKDNFPVGIDVHFFRQSIIANNLSEYQRTLFLTRFLSLFLNSRVIQFMVAVLSLQRFSSTLLTVYFTPKRWFRTKLKWNFYLEVRKTLKSNFLLFLLCMRQFASPIYLGGHQSWMIIFEDWMKLCPCQVKINVRWHATEKSVVNTLVKIQWFKKVNKYTGNLMDSFFLQSHNFFPFNWVVFKNSIASPGH